MKLTDEELQVMLAEIIAAACKAPCKVCAHVPAKSAAVFEDQDESNELEPFAIPCCQDCYAIGPKLIIGRTLFAMGKGYVPLFDKH